MGDMTEPVPLQPELLTTVAARLERVESYKDEVGRILTTVPRETIDLWSIFRDDALVVSHFFDSLPGTIAVLDVGTFVGVSAFVFACQPNVAHVTTVDPNPFVQDELREVGGAAGIATIPTIAGLAQHSRVHDIARAALEGFPEERDEIQFEIGVITGGDDSVQEVAVPDPSVYGADLLVAFLDGLHTTPAVYSDLTAIFGAKPNAIVMLDDCRYFWGPFVQAGVAKFLESNPDFSFRLVCDSSSVVGTCTLGVVSHRDARQMVDDAMERTVAAVAAAYGTLGAVDLVAGLQQEVTLLSEQLADSRRKADEIAQVADEAAQVIEQMRQTRVWRIGERISSTRQTLRLGARP